MKVTTSNIHFRVSSIVINYFDDRNYLTGDYLSCIVDTSVLCTVQ